VDNPLGTSLRWFQGKENWLFLGNAFNQTIDKLTLKIVPPKDTLEKTADTFERLASTAEIYGIRVSLLVGSSKPSVYMEYLPSQIVISKKRYIDYFIERLNEIQNLLVYDPTQDLIESKLSEGLLYYRTDTHWNDKGAYVAYQKLMKNLRVPIPNVGFKASNPIAGDLIGISGLRDFPLQGGDNWEVIWKDGKTWSLEVSLQNGLFNNVVKTTNEKAPSNKSVWVIGDSFSTAVNPYLFATFKRVSYIGSWQENIGSLPEKLRQADVKPDLVIVIATERSF
jgi:hypothetical protein